MNKLHKSESLSLEQLALVETLGIGHHAVGRGRPEPGETVAVVGAGPIGLGVMQFALLEGARVIALDVSPRRLDFCRRAFGIEHLLDARENPVDALKALTDGDLPTLVFDATGNPTAMEQSLFYAANGGRVVFVSLVQADISFPDPEFHRRELTLYATRNSTAHDFRRVLEHIESGGVDTTAWVTHRADADAMIEAFPTWLEPESGTVKAVVAF
jgi:threonine dehydrogenase-like Zn-dependent dehydrogenase